MRSVAIITGPQTHLDHLGILSSQLKIPLIVTEEHTFQLAKRFYPDLNISLKGYDELSIEYLARHFDVIFETGKFWAAELSPFFELLFHKKMRFVFCPHGNSDKGHSLQNHVDQDISLVYGEHLHDLLKKTGAAHQIRHILRTGNYRYPYYLKHRIFYDALTEKIVFQRFQNKNPSILYAPTWQDRENPTSFFSATSALIEQLSSSFNLIIKLHPFLADHHPAEVYQVISRYENHPSALFLTDFPPIYPLLSRCDLYLGDYSSIGYDFLAFDKPLYFLNPKKAPSPSPLHTCGLEIPENAWDELTKFLLSTIEQNTREFALQRQKMYTYAFGDELAPETIRLNIFKLTRQ